MPEYYSPHPGATSRATAHTRTSMPSTQDEAERTSMRKRSRSVTRQVRNFVLLLWCLPALAIAQGQLNLYCSSPNTAWCQGMAIGFEKAQGTKVAVLQKATGEMFAQIKAEAANPKGDVWWAG